MVDLEHVRSRVQSITDSPTGRRVLKGLRWLLIGAIVTYLVYQLTQMGWGRFWESLPQTPWFYLTVLVMYTLLPASEVLIYGRIWGWTPSESLPLMMRKRVLNADVVGYSGEVFLLAHARAKLERPARQIAAEIKDNLILSSAASIGVAVLVLTVLLASGYVALDELLGNATPGYVVLGGVVMALVAGLAVQFRDAIFSLGTATLGVLLSIHFGRFLLSSILQVVQWWVVLPDAPFSAWATLLVVFIVTNRIPFLPSRDLVFAGVGIEASASLGVPGPAVAGMLLTRSVIDRVFNFGFFTLFSVWDGEEMVATDDGDPSTDLDPTDLDLDSAEAGEEEKQAGDGTGAVREAPDGPTDEASPSS